MVLPVRVLTKLEGWSALSLSLSLWVRTDGIGGEGWRELTSALRLRAGVSTWCLSWHGDVEDGLLIAVFSVDVSRV